MTKKNTLLMFTLLMGFCLLQSIHAANTARSSFQITSVLVEPVDMAVDKADSKVAVRTYKQKSAVAILSEHNNPNIKVHVSVDQNDALVACNSGACKGDKIELANLILKNFGYGVKKKLELDAIDQLALNDKPGQYSGDVKVMLATI